MVDIPEGVTPAWQCPHCPKGLLVAAKYKHKYLVARLKHRDEEHLEVLSHSVLGLADVYNELPPALVETCSAMKHLQKQLQALVFTQVHERKEGWQQLLPARLRSWERKLRALRGWSYKLVAQEVFLQA